MTWYAPEKCRPTAPRARRVDLRARHRRRRQQTPSTMTDEDAPLPKCRWCQAQFDQDFSAPSYAKIASESSRSPDRNPLSRENTIRPSSLAPTVSAHLSYEKRDFLAPTHLSTHTGIRHPFTSQPSTPQKFIILQHFSTIYVEHCCVAGIISDGPSQGFIIR